MAYGKMAQLVDEPRGGNRVARSSWGMRAVELGGALGEAEIVVYALANIGAGRAGDERPRGGRARPSGAWRSRSRPGSRSASRRAYINLGLGSRYARASVRARRAAPATRRIKYCERTRPRLVGAVPARPPRPHAARPGALDRGGATRAARVVPDPRRATEPPALARGGARPVRTRRGDPEVWAPLDEALELAPDRRAAAARAGRGARAEARWLAGAGTARPRPSRRWRSRRSSTPAGRSASCVLLARRAGSNDRRAGGRRPSRSSSPARSRGRGALWTALGARTRRRSRSPQPTTRRPCGERSTSCSALGAAAAAASSPASCASAAQPTAARTAGGDAREPGQLTARELEVLALVADGLRDARHRGAPVPVAQDRRPPRLGDPAQARHAHRGEAGSQGAAARTGRASQDA